MGLWREIKEVERQVSTFLLPDMSQIPQYTTSNFIMQLEIGRETTHLVFICDCVFPPHCSSFSVFSLYLCHVRMSIKPPWMTVFSSKHSTNCFSSNPIIVYTCDGISQGKLITRSISVMSVATNTGQLCWPLKSMLAKRSVWCPLRLEEAG